MKYFLRLPALLGLILFINLFFFTANYAHADNLSSGVANLVQILDKNVQNGDIISSSANGYVLSRSAYDQAMFGVVETSPGLVFVNSNVKGGTPVVSSGKVYVQVSTANGIIQTNDLITTSPTAGVGEKATRDGNVIGTALAPYTSSDKKKVGTILVSLNPHFATIGQGTSTNIFAALQSANSEVLLSPLTSLRYLLAVIVTAFSFGFGFLYFGGLSRHSMDAFGRNPLAAKYIRQGLIVNVTIAILIIISGLGVSYLILVL